MIVVFCELGGSRLLGKAREIADTTGDKLVALTSEKSEERQQKLIHLGADEVIGCAIDNLSDWIPVISGILESVSDVKMIVFPSNSTANILMGLLYSGSKRRFSPFWMEPKLST